MSEKRAPAGTGDQIRELLASELRRALRGRAGPAVSALRSALAAISNAEAVPPAPPHPPGPGAGPIAGAVTGLRAGEAARRPLSDDEIVRIVQAEIADRLAAADQYHAGGHDARASELHQEADVLASVLRNAGMQIT